MKDTKDELGWIDNVLSMMIGRSEDPLLTSALCEARVPIRDALMELEGKNELRADA